MTLRVLENFAGIGTQRMALENLGIEHEVVGITEIDKFAIKSYEAIHGPVNNLGDISLVDPNDVPDHDLFTYSFPCTDVSLAGKGKGFEKGSGTRSGLLWECEKVIRAKRPKYLLMENVKNLISKKFMPSFEKWLNVLEELGYTNYVEVLNAKDFSIPQNRERVFCVSILGEHEPYEFPEKETLELRLKDILEHEVDEKFYLDDDKASKLIFDIGKTQIGYIPYTSDGKQHQSNTVYNQNNISPTLSATDYKSPKKILVKNNTKQGYVEATDGDGIDLSFPNSSTRRGRVQKDLAQTLDTSDSKGVVVADDLKVTEPKIGGSLSEKKKTDTIKILRTLQDKIGKEAYAEWEIRGLRAIQSKKVLRQDVYEERLDAKKNREPQERTVKSPERENEGGIFHGNQKVSEVFVDRKLGRSSQGSESYEQFSRELGSFMQELSHETSSQERELSDLWETAEGFRVVQQALHQIQEVWRPELYKIPSFRIRKLSPLECWRLMGISDENFEKAQEVNSNSQLYKQAGNAIVVDVLEAIFANMFK